MTLVMTSAGQRLNPDAAASYEALNAAFTARFGKRLTISSGARTYEEQVRIFTTNHQLTPILNNGRYITRKWQGKTWYLKPGYATAAVPGTSNHEDPPGRAADFGAGVQTRGSVEHNWMLNNAGAYGWTWTGKNFVTVEPWHWEKTFSWAGTGGGSTPTTPTEAETGMRSIHSPGRPYANIGPGFYAEITAEAYNNSIWPRVELNDRQFDLAVASSTGPVKTMPTGGMVIIKDNAGQRTPALVGPGYFRALNDEELSNVSVLADRTAVGNTRQYDLWVSIALAGQGASFPVVADVDVKKLIDGVLAGLPAGTLTKADVESAVTAGLSNLVLKAQS